jgi:predicted component of type VI protein secretion system
MNQIKKEIKEQIKHYEAWLAELEVLAKNEGDEVKPFIEFAKERIAANKKALKELA